MGINFYKRYTVKERCPDAPSMTIWGPVFALTLALLVMMLAAGSAQAFTVHVVDQYDNPVSGFKWLLEEDNTNPPEPGNHRPVDTTDVHNNTLAISLHKSHAPVVASGEESSLSSTAIAAAPGKYFVSVLPYGDRAPGGVTYDMGGSPVTVVDNSEVVTVYVRSNPIETAQVSIKVFHDGNGGPLNNAPDADEPGLAGFTVTLTDQGGDIVQDYFGNPLCGTGDCVTDANGEIIITNLAPNKYGIQVEPPAGEGWYQTTTIEGTQTIDAWVRPNEPPFLVEFGPPFWHAFYGFTQLYNNLPPGGSTITGQVLKGHLSRPPDIQFNEGPPPEAEAVGERCLVGLNLLEGGNSQGLFADLCEDGTGNFTIPNVPAGTYQLVIWDISLLHIISFDTVIVDGVNSVALGSVITPMWFGLQENNVLFGDVALNDYGLGIPEQNINLRFRDGTIYQAFPTDGSGFVPFQAVFPFFHWLVNEVDFAERKATGLRVVNDLGGPVTFDPDGEGKRNPSAHEQTGTVLTQAFQLFAGQNQRFDYTKNNYGLNENGGISGTLTYATTRAEDDPQYAAVETWEPGIPRAQVSLYKDLICNSNGLDAVFPICPEAIAGEVGDGIPDPVDPASAVYPYVPTYADVDNYPLDNFPGPEDVDNGAPGVFDYGDALMVAYTDSWDDSPPTGCELGTGTPVSIHGTDVPIDQCAEGLRTWNQTVPGVFDGGWAFGPGIDAADLNAAIADPDTVTAIGADGDRYLLPATYIVKAATPPGYQVVKEEDRNVDFGPTPIPAILPPRCVGEDHVVPELFSFLTQADGITPLPGVDPNDPDNWAPYSHNPDGSYPAPPRPLCDAKKVDLGSGQNAAAEFHLFTDVPKAARAVGLITDDLANELAPGKPAFTEKYSPPWFSIAVFDYTGRQINHTYGDEFGAYNFLAPSSYAIDLPTPSGVGPKMLQFCLNYPFLPDGSEDPRHRAQYSTTCYTFNFETGRTTYLDTPVIRQAAFVGALQNQLDCEEPAGSPVIAKVTPAGDPVVNGTWINGTAGEQIAIWAAGDVQVRNPAYPGGTLGNPDDPPSEPEFIMNHYGFGGTAGMVTLNGTVLDIFSWSDDQIVAQVPAGGLAVGTYQLTVINAAGMASPYGVTVTVDPTRSIVRVGPTQAIATIQAGIDAAPANALVLVDPGIYRELPIIYKRIALQGAGAGATTIVGSHFSSGSAFTNPLVAWRNKIDDLANAGQLGLLPGQDPAVPDFFLKDGEGPGVFVSPPPGVFTGMWQRLDGFTVTLADLGGGIYVNAYADQFQVSNNVLKSNAGNLGGGIRVGNPTVAAFARGGVAIPDGSANPNLNIHHNQINHNGSLTVGGGIALFKGADGYTVSENRICGNLARNGGGGIAHRGLSDDGTIGGNNAQSGNIIAFNEVFQGDQPGPGLGAIGGGGGGVEIAGDPDLDATGMTEGTGSVTIAHNLLQGNLGGSADGGGIALREVNGDDVVTSNNPNNWYTIDINRNLIVNNVSGSGGGGLSLQDAVNVEILRNTIAHNDSTATSVFAGIGAPPTAPQPAGIVSRPHSGLLADATGQTFSDPGTLDRNILYENRSFYWDDTAAGNIQGGLLPLAAAPVYWDLGVAGAGAACLSPTRSRLTLLTYPIDPGCTYPSTGGQGNSTGDPNFTAAYYNDLLAAAAADEGGNFVQVYYTPLGVQGDYTDTVGGAGP